MSLVMNNRALVFPLAMSSDLQFCATLVFPFTIASDSISCETLVFPLALASDSLTLRTVFPSTLASDFSAL